MIKLDSISLQRGNKFLLENASLSIYPGEKWGLIGANGSGKTSLFKIILRELHEDAGEISIPSQWRIAHMAQEVSESRQSALDHVLDGDEEFRRVEKELHEHNGEDGEALAHLYEKFEHLDGYTAQARAETLLNGLGFKPGDAQRNVSDFSGGWRIRLNLARALMCPSDLLLLDEPTNHLDLDACVWLEGWLQQYRGTLLIISHDRDFLDNVVNGIVHLDNQRLNSYAGNYSAFERQRAEHLAQQAQAFAKQQEQIAHMEDFVRRFRAKATKARQAQSRLKALERMEKIVPAHIQSPFTFRFPQPERVPQTLITLSAASIGHANPLLKNVELSILGGSRIGLLGANGAGKSTLIKALAGDLALLSGKRDDSPFLKIGYFAQHQLEALDLSASAALHLQRLSPRASEQEVRNFLGSFDFRGDRAFETIAHFSGGEKARLALAIVAWQKPNILLLDEPTNHLDLEMCHALNLALQEYEGAIVLVSHDRHLLKNSVDEFLLVDHGEVSAFDGDLDDYQRYLSQKRQGERPSKAEQELKPVATESASKRRDNGKALRSEVRKLEQQIETMQRRLAEIEGALSDSSVYDKSRQEDLTKLLRDQAVLKSDLGSTEDIWLQKLEALENL